MQERHRDRKIYFEEQGITTKKYVIPYIEEILPITKDIRILEIGCGEGGNLIPFIEKGCEVAGVDISKSQIENAKKFINEKFPN
jgi:cyclopropane fatty-acyl-phospholipid synthase-like methyltransferase